MEINFQFVEAGFMPAGGGIAGVTAKVLSFPYNGGRILEEVSKFFGKNKVCRGNY